MKEIFSFVGHEHGGKTPNGAVNASAIGSTQMSGNPVLEKWGRRGYQWEYLDGSGLTPSPLEAYSQAFAQTVQPVGVARTYMGVEAFPVGRNMLLAVVQSTQSNINPVLAIRLKPDGFVEAGFAASGSTGLQAATLTPTVTSLERFCAQRWHRLDLRINGTANPWVVDWMIDGVTQPQLTNPVAAGTWAMIRYGNSSTQHVGNVTKLYLDDSAVGSNGSSYPFGPGESHLLRVNDWVPFYPTQLIDYPPASDPNIVMYWFEDGTKIFEGDIGAPWFITATNPYDVWRRISAGVMENNIPAASAGDGLSLQLHEGFTASARIVFHFEDITLGADQEIGCVIGWIERYMSASPVPAPTAPLEIYAAGPDTSTSPPGPSAPLQLLLRDTNTGTSGNVITGRPLNDGNQPFMEKLITPSFGGGEDIGMAWSEARLNSLVAVWTAASASSTEDPARYHGLSLLALEAHLISDIEHSKIGCLNEVWGRIANR
jgi:hypothetical protein